MRVNLPVLGYVEANVKKKFGGNGLLYHNKQWGLIYKYERFAGLVVFLIFL